MPDRARGAEKGLPVHWIGDAPTSLHGNGAASFERTTRNAAEVTCRLCTYLLLADPPERPVPPGGGADA